MSALLLTKIGVLLYKEPSWKYTFPIFHAHPHDLHFVLVNFFTFVISLVYLSRYSSFFLTVCSLLALLLLLFFLSHTACLFHHLVSSSFIFLLWVLTSSCSVVLHLILLSFFFFFFFFFSVEFVHNLSTKCIPAGSLISAGIDWNCMRRPKRLGSLICVQVSRLYRIKKKNCVGCVCSRVQ